MRRFAWGWGLTSLLLIGQALGTLVWAQTAPRLTQTTPVNGAQGVAVDLGRMLLGFDRPMRTTSLTVLGVAGYATPPLVAKPNASDYWRDASSCELPLRALTPDTDYAVQLNSAERTGFQSAEQVPLAPTVLRFRTGGAQVSRMVPPPAPSGPPNAGPPEASLVGTWLVRTQEMEILAVLKANGTFSRQTRTQEGQDFTQGRYQVTGDTLIVIPDQDAPIRFRYGLVDANTLEVTDENGDGVRMVRQGDTPPSVPLPAVSSSPQTDPSHERGPSISGDTASGASGARPTLVLQRQWEKNERAYSILVPRGWQMEGGIFNVNPLQANGPGNSIAPKNDLTIRQDASGRVMSRWMPGWNYADFSVDPTPAAQFFPVGSQYQGMEVKPMPTAQGFLLALFSTLHPGASDVQTITSNSFPEIQQAYQKSLQAVNQALLGLGKSPAQVDVLGLTIDYTEQGTRYREGLFTAIIDMRGGAFMWSNELTYVTRAPASEAGLWGPMMTTIRNSFNFNPDWIKRVRQAMGERATIALETQRYINQVNREITENRARTHEKINYENYLMLTGQDEYVNPYSQQVERDTSEYRHRWVNPNGEYLYTDEVSFDPNQDRTLNQVEWKLTPIRAR